MISVHRKLRRFVVLNRLEYRLTDWSRLRRDGAVVCACLTPHKRQNFLSSNNPVPQLRQGLIATVVVWSGSYISRSSHLSDLWTDPDCSMTGNVAGFMNLTRRIAPGATRISLPLVS